MAEPNYQKLARKLNMLNNLIDKRYKKTKDKDKFFEDWEKKAKSLENRYDKKVIDSISDGEKTNAESLKYLADSNFYANGTERTFLTDAVNDWIKLGMTLK